MLDRENPFYQDRHLNPFYSAALCSAKVGWHNEV